MSLPRKETMKGGAKAGISKKLTDKDMNAGRGNRLLSHTGAREFQHKLKSVVKPQWQEPNLMWLEE